MGSATDRPDADGRGSWCVALLRTKQGSRLRRRLNSSRLIPGPVRVAIGGRIYQSGDYRRTVPADIDELDGWKRPIVARRQRSLRAGYSRSAADPVGPGSAALQAALRAAQDVGSDPSPSGSPQRPVILEVGCGGTANAAIIQAAVPSCRYVGLDFAWPMVAGARADHPGLPVVNGDATALPFADHSVAVVVDGAMLIHIPEWRAALAESCRVAQNSVVLHTITITDAPTTVIRKRAYGFWVPEVLYNRADLAGAIESHGYTVEGTWPSIDYDLSDVLGITTKSETWLCRRTLMTDGRHDSPRMIDRA